MKQDLFKFINSYFDKVYVITLERAADRLEHFKRELDGLDYAIFYGKDKKLFNIEDLKEANIYNESLARQHHRYGKPMQPGMIGCSWSHRLVYEDIVKNNYNRALILEDDVVIDINTTAIVRQAFSELPLGWELVYLGFEANESAPASSGLKKLFYHALRFFKRINYSHKTISHLYPRKIDEHIYTSGYHDCTHAYGITLSGAKKLIGIQTPISYIADNLLAYAATNEIIKAYIIQPKIIYQQYQLTQDSTYSYLNS